MSINLKQNKPKAGGYVDGVHMYKWKFVYTCVHMNKKNTWTTKT